MKLLNPLPQRLDTGATATFAGLLADDGTAAAPSISFAADTDTGFYRAGTNSVGISCGGVEGFRVLVSGGTTFWAGQAGFGYLTLPYSGGAAGSIGLVAGGNNQNITLTPSGTGAVVTSSPMVVGASSLFNATYTFQQGDGSGTGRATFRNSTVFALGLNQGGAANGQFFLGASAAATPDLILSSNTGAETARFMGNGRLLIGTPNDSVNGILQLASSAANTGGIGFGTDTSFYRSAAGVLDVSHNGSTTPFLRFIGNGTVYSQVGNSGANMFIDATQAGGTITLRTNINVTALTLDATPNATFAGRVRTADGTLAVPGHSFGNDTASGMYRAGTNTLGFSSGGVLSLTLGGFGEVVCGPAALGTTTTDGFFYLRAMAGAPTGVPTAFTGRVAATYDSTNNKLYIYNGAWKSVTLT
jgi:hypothetical protein